MLKRKERLFKWRIAQSNQPENRLFAKNRIGERGNGKISFLRGYRITNFPSWRREMG